MTEHRGETWQQNDYDPKFIETDEGLRIARAFEEVGAEQMVREHNTFRELLESLQMLVSQIDDWERSVQAIVGKRRYPWDDLEGARRVLQEAQRAQTPKERR